VHPQTSIGVAAAFTSTPEPSSLASSTITTTLAFAKVKRASVANADADRRHHIRDGHGRNTCELAVNKTDEQLFKSETTTLIPSGNCLTQS
jgi:hypothetical protein